MTVIGGLEAERVGPRMARIIAMRRARPWPERPVSEANKSGDGIEGRRDG